MRPGAIQLYFHNRLISHYDEREIRSMFFLILEVVFNTSRVQFFSGTEREFSDSEIRKLKAIIRQLRNYKPLQYIIGKSVFYGLEFLVNPFVLIPRPETEELADLVLQQFKSDSIDNQVINILDLGTGSGCLSVTLAKYLPTSQVWGCDISGEALLLAAANAEGNQVKVDFFKLDILNQSLPESLPLFDIIISNPPYVRESEKNQMKTNVLAFEPYEALFVPDEDPLLFYKAIAGIGKSKLKPKGKLFLEINEEFGKEVVSLLEKYTFTGIRIWNDIHGKDRFVEAIKT